MCIPTIEMTTDIAKETGLAIEVKEGIAIVMSVIGAKETSESGIGSEIASDVKEARGAREATATTEIVKEKQETAKNICADSTMMNASFRGTMVNPSAAGQR